MQQQHTGIIVVVCKTPSFQMFPLLAINAHAVRNTTVCGSFPHHKTAATEFVATVPGWKIRGTWTTASWAAASIRTVWKLCYWVHYQVAPTNEWNKGEVIIMSRSHDDTILFSCPWYLHVNYMITVWILAVSWSGEVPRTTAEIVGNAERAVCRQGLRHRKCFLAM